MLDAIRRFCDWLVSFFTTPPEDLSVVATHMEKPFDWFAWECEQYSETGAPWFDHYRYDGTPFAYKDPSEADRRKNWERCLRRARERYSEYELSDLERWAQREMPGVFDGRSSYARSPDPIEWAMKQYRQSMN